MWHFHGKPQCFSPQIPSPAVRLRSVECTSQTAEDGIWRQMVLFSPLKQLCALISSRVRAQLCACVSVCVYH